MADVSEDRIRDLLCRIPAPNMSNIVDGGLVAGIIIKDRMVQVTLEIDDPKKARDFEPVRRHVEKQLEAMEGVLSATAILTAEAAPGTPPPPMQADTGPGSIRHIIAVASGKGGVGKSTSAVNIALGLRKLGLSVGMLDADIYGPSQPRMLGLAGRRPDSPDGKTLNPLESYGIKVMSIGFMLAEDQPVVWRGPMVMGALKQMLDDVHWGALDVLVVDMPPGTGDAQLTLSQNVSLSGAVIVSTPQDIALLDARKGLNMFNKVNVPVLGIVENMSLYICPKCGHEADIFGHGGARDEAERLGVPFLGEIPLHIDIRETADGGHPIVESDPQSAHAQAYHQIARAIHEALFGAPSAHNGSGQA